MYLEDSNGRILENPTPSQVTAALEQVGTTIDHCVLGLAGDSFVQTTGGPGRLLVQYGGPQGLFESARSDFDVATVSRIFTDAMNGSDGWKSEYTFAPAGTASAAPGTASAAPGTAPGGSLKDQIMGSVRQQAEREVSYGFGRMVRRLIRSVIGRTLR
jgi:hypothetical protein